MLCDVFIYVYLISFLIVNRELMAVDDILFLNCRWPVCQCLVAFYSSGYPLQRAEAYAALRR